MGINVKFIKNGQVLGYAIGTGEADHVAFPKAQLRFLTDYKLLKGSTMIFLDDQSSVFVVELKEDSTDKSIAIDCSVWEDKEVA